MSHEEITKNIVVAMIERGLLDYCDNNVSQNDRKKERLSAICEAFTEIDKTVQKSMIIPL